MTLVPRPTVNTLSGVIQTTKSGCFQFLIVPVMGVGVTRRTLPSRLPIVKWFCSMDASLPCPNTTLGPTRLGRQSIMRRLKQAGTL